MTRHAAIDGPDWNAYPDQGCEYAPRCVDCPLPACRYDLMPGSARMQGQMVALIRLLERGVSIADAATRLGISHRGAYRLRERAMRILQIAGVPQSTIEYALDVIRRPRQKNGSSG